MSDRVAKFIKAFADRIRCKTPRGARDGISAVSISHVGAVGGGVERDLRKRGSGPPPEGVWAVEALHAWTGMIPFARCGVGDGLGCPRSRSLGISWERESFSLLAILVLLFLRQGSPLVEASEPCGSLRHPQPYPSVSEDTSS